LWLDGTMGSATHQGPSNPFEKHLPPSTRLVSAFCYVEIFGASTAPKRAIGKKGRKKKRWKKGNVGLWLDGTMGSATHQGPSILDTFFSFKRTPSLSASSEPPIRETLTSFHTACVSFLLGCGWMARWGQPPTKVPAYLTPSSGLNLGMIVQRVSFKRTPSLSASSEPPIRETLTSFHTACVSFLLC
jgi:hypothetical protein